MQAMNDFQVQAAAFESQLRQDAAMRALAKLQGQPSIPTGWRDEPREAASSSTDVPKASWTQPTQELAADQWQHDAWMVDGASNADADWRGDDASPADQWQHHDAWMSDGASDAGAALMGDVASPGWRAEDWSAAEWQAWEECQAENEVAAAMNLKWKYRGPPAPQPEAMTTARWKKQQWRSGSERWANRGGSRKEWFAAYYGMVSQGIPKDEAKRRADELHPEIAK